MKCWHILLLLLALGPMAAGQSNVHLVGQLENGAGKELRLYGYSDMLTMEEVLLDSARADSVGRFELAFYANYPRLVYVEIENYSQSFYVEAGRRYEMYLPAFDWSINEQQNVKLMPVALPFEFVGLPEDELNLKIGRMEAAVDSVLLLHRARLDARYKPDRRYFDTLCAAALRAVPTAPGTDDFYTRYRDYSLALMRYDMRFDRRDRMVQRWVEGQEIRYYDEAYMRLFFGLMKDALSKGTRRIPMWRMTEWVEHQMLDVYLDSVGLDPMLRNEQVRELAFIEAMKESFYNPAYDRYGVMGMVGKLAVRSKFREHRELCNSLLREMGRVWGSVQTVQLAVLPDVERVGYSLDDFKGKWVYLSFVRVGEAASLGELETMAHFADSIGDETMMVTVCCDREFQKMYHLLRNSRRGSRYRWTWLHFDGNYRWLEQMGVVSYPTFMLIDPVGHVVDRYAKWPATGILMNRPWEGKASKPAGE